MKREMRVHAEPALRISTQDDCRTARTLEWLAVSIKARRRPGHSCPCRVARDRAMQFFNFEMERLNLRPDTRPLLALQRRLPKHKRGMGAKARDLGCEQPTRRHEIDRANTPLPIAKPIAQGLEMCRLVGHDPPIQRPLSKCHVRLPARSSPPHSPAQWNRQSSLDRWLHLQRTRRVGTLPP